MEAFVDCGHDGLSEFHPPFVAPPDPFCIKSVFITTHDLCNLQHTWLLKFTLPNKMDSMQVSLRSEDHNPLVVWPGSDAQQASNERPGSRIAVTHGLLKLCLFVF